VRDVGLRLLNAAEILSNRGVLVHAISDADVPSMRLLDFCYLRPTR